MLKWVGHINWKVGWSQEVRLEMVGLRTYQVLVMLKDFILKEQESHWRDFSREVSGSGFFPGAIQRSDRRGLNLSQALEIHCALSAGTSLVGGREAGPRAF